MTSTAKNYLIVTASYWGFTLVDGALRMLVLLHFFRMGYTPFALAFLFLLYEAAGIAANLAGGYFASKYGIPRMLAAGQLLQIAGLLMLSCLDAQWSQIVSVAWVVGLSTFGGYGVHLVVVRRSGPTRASTLLYLTPPTTMIWAYLIVDRRIVGAGSHDGRRERARRFLARHP